jgi:hypothetical protein
VTAIPAELQAGKRFVVWRMERRDGEPTKIPYNVSGERAKSNDPATWATFEDAVLAYALSSEFAGLGIMLAGGEIACIDLDHCRDPETGVIDEPAAAVIRELASYTEVSPSGAGVHIFVFGTPPSGRRRAGYVEMYGPNDHRYITLTGRSIDGKAHNALRRVDLPALHRRLFPHDEDDRTSRTIQASSGASSCNFTDDEVIDRATNAGNGAKFRRLFDEGDFADYDSHSEARFALLSVLAFWSQDEAQLWRLYERSALYRGDGDERKVVDHDIPGAIRSTTNRYEPPSVGIGTITRSTGDDDDRPVVVTTPEVDFPFDVLPGALRALAKEGAAATGTAAEAIAVHGLAVLGAALGASARIRIGSWSQRPVLWTATVARPGTAKSTALNLAKKPLDDFDAETHEAWLAARKLDKLAVWRRTLADNVTVEKLARLLVENPRGLLIAADELAGLVSGMNQYKGGKGSDRQSYLQLWSVASLRVDRVTTDPIYLREPLVSITGGIQPDRLDMLRGGDGMTGRWLIAYLENRGRAIPTDADISAASRAWKMLVDGLIRREGGDKAIEYKLSAAGYARYKELRDAEIRACNDETDPDFADWLGKFESHLARLMLVLWASENDTPVIHESFVDRAHKLARYFADGAKAHVQAAAVDPTLKPWERGIDEIVEKCRAWFARHPGKSWRDLQRNKVAGLRTADAAKVARSRYEAIYGVDD